MMTLPNKKKTVRKRKAAVKAVAAKPINSAAEFEELLKHQKSGAQNYVLRLYITGITPRSTEAIYNIRSLCEEHLKGRYQLEIIDIYQQPDQASVEQIIAAPTLIRKIPTPPRRIVGNLSDPSRVILVLDLKTKNPPVKPAAPTHWIKV